MAKLLLHIGQTKTATTTIQAFLHRAQELLATHGCHYLWRPARARSHRFLFHLLYLEAFPHAPRLIENRLARMHAQGVRWSSTTPLGVCNELWFRLMESFSTCIDGYGLISEELLWHLGWFHPDLRDELLHLLRQRLVKLVEPHELVIVVVLRAHPDWCESWHNQMVKDQGHQEQIRSFTTRLYEDGAFAYAANLQAWRSVFPEATLLVRDFHSGLLAGPYGPALNLLADIEASTGHITAVSALSFEDISSQRTLQESIHPFVHQYVMRHKPPYRDLSRYKQLLKRASRKCTRYAEKNFPSRSFTVLPSDLQLALADWSNLDPLLRDGWMDVPPVSRLSSRTPLPKPLPRRVKQICDELLNDC